MADALVLVRHGETEWSRSGRHTSTTDLPLTEHGRAQALAAASHLSGLPIDLVVTSPMHRALTTADLLAVDAPREVWPAFHEWNYGHVEGRTTRDIRTEVPGWDLWHDGAPGGESIDDVAQRCAETVRRVESMTGTLLVVAHAHILSAFTATWLDMEVPHGARFPLDTATVSVLGHKYGDRVIRQWNARANPGVELLAPIV